MKNIRPKQIDATTGPLVRSIFLYAFPLAVANLVQSLFHTADLAVLGNMADSVAVASVGVASPFISLVLNAVLGAASGLKPLISRLTGAHDREQAHKTVDTSLLTALIAGVLLAVLGIALVPSFLRWINCPADCFEGAVLYTRIYLAAAPFILILNVGHAVVAGGGDTQRPLIYIVVSGLLNVALNIVLCLILPQKVVAVAVATAASQVLAAALMFGRLCRMDGICRVSPREMRIHPSSLGSILRFGLPVALTAVIVPLSNLQIQSAINAYGSSAVAGNSASGSFEGIINALAGAFSSSVGVFVGQNLGARKLDRVKASMFHCLWIGAAVSSILGALFYLTADLWLPLILTSDAVAIDYAKIRMFHVVLFYFVFTVNAVVTHVLQAYGFAFFTTLNTVVCVFGFRVLWMQAFYPRNNTFGFIMLCFPISQVLMILCGSAALAIIFRLSRKRAEQSLPQP